MADSDPSAAASSDRLVLEKIIPSVEGGDFAVKRVVGEQVRVEATLFADGHEQLGAELQWRACDQAQWQRARMEQLPNDLWRAEFPLLRMGGHEFVVEGWLDRFGGFCRDFAKKLDAKVAQPVDFAEGRVLVERALDRAEGTARDSLVQFLARLDEAGSGDSAAAILLSPELAALMDSLDERPHRIRSEPQRVDAERLAARFSSWYELFPRSQTNDAARHGTFADVIGRLPAIREMGFDTLYFPPIHPIGKTNRKGPNNSLTPGPNDPGSPYAIGAPEGGHDAIHPELGRFEDFARLIAAARDHGLEIALDFAIQCSPDHPWLREHPGWFAWRPDGSMKYAENPPKKYQDIVNVDFYGPDAVPDLWLALRDVVLFWIGHGVKTFRVDNPHTKPLPFWEWMIAEVRSQHPDAIFLAEAFTRPAMMYRLAKIGFSQSYTYFTWRDEKAELVEYVTELITTEPKEFYRPHFFVNTPDINPPFLQTSGRPGFRIRAVLAATLSGLFGVYSGFELCEAAPVPGKEEYLDSEKYEIRPRDWNAPGNIIADIALLNRLRRSEPALQTHLNTRFQVVHNDRIIYYAKPASDGSDMILVMVSLDPHHRQEGTFEIPLWEFGLPDDGNVAVEDLAEGHRFRWYGKAQHIRLDPEQPYRIWRIAPGERT
ncbi:alpha-1,4-glucan--maltose-1-phosphate maltosyltransferase [Sphingobium sp. SCG-1]|nr:alpha-1,4-glucan--maltose-1-phosphate maltosyltransferase [Sphingobium sp. SCG-1]